MRFNLLLADQSTDRLQELEDAVRPVLFGLRAAGHAVGVSRRGLKAAPIANVAVDVLVEPELVEEVRSSRGTSVSAPLFGILCTTPLQALAASPREVVRAALMLSDFTWVVEGVAVAPDLADSRNKAHVVYGFDGAVCGQHVITDPTLRDIDVVIYARESARSDALVAQLGKLGLSHCVVQPGALPDYLASDLLSRGKVAVVLGDGLKSGLAPRLAKVVSNAVAVITEPGTLTRQFGTGVIELPGDDIADRCVAIIRGGDYVELGRRALEIFRDGISMADGLRAALDLPAFRRAAGD